MCPNLELPFLTCVTTCFVLYSHNPVFTSHRLVQAWHCISLVPAMTGLLVNAIY